MELIILKAKLISNLVCRLKIIWPIHIEKFQSRTVRLGVITTSLLHLEKPWLQRTSVGVLEKLID